MIPEGTPLLPPVSFLRLYVRFSFLLQTINDDDDNAGARTIAETAASRTGARASPTRKPPKTSGRTTVACTASSRFPFRGRAAPWRSWPRKCAKSAASRANSAATAASRFAPSARATRVPSRTKPASSRNREGAGLLPPRACSASKKVEQKIRRKGKERERERQSEFMKKLPIRYDSIQYAPVRSDSKR